MKNKFLIFFLLLGVTSIYLTVFSQQHYKELKYPELRDIKVPSPEVITLDNGMKILILEDHELPFIKIRAEFIAGSIYDPDDKVGLARLTGNVMRTGGSLNMPGDQIDEELESIAAIVETWIEDVSGGASLFTLKDHFDKVFSIFADVLMHPAFPEEKIKLEKIDATSSISRRNDNITSIARREFYQVIYKNSPFWRDEEYATIESITRDDMIAYHKKYVRPEHMVLGIWGDFKAKNVINKIKKIFKDWKAIGSEEFKIPEINYKFEKTINLVKKSDVNQTSIYMGHLGDKKNNPDLPAITMLNEIFGTSSTSRLFSRIRSDQGLAYQVYGVYQTKYQYPGIFGMICRTKSESTVEAITSMQKELKLITQELVTDKELKIAKEGWLNSFVFNFDEIDEIMTRLITYTFNGYPMDFLQKTKEGIKKVTREDVLRVAKKYLQPENIHILAVGNPENFDSDLSVLGTVNEIDITIPQPAQEIPESTEENLDKGRELVEKMAEALGGREKLISLENISVTLHMTQMTPGGEMILRGNSTFIYPDKLYTIITTPQGEMKFYISGNDVWMSSVQGTMPAPEQMKTSMLNGRIRDLVLLIKNIDLYTVQYNTETIFNENPAEELVITKDNYSYSLYLDKNSFLPLGLKYNTIMQQGPVEIVEYYSDYREVNGIRRPFKSSSFDKDKKVAEVSLLDVKFNIDIDLSIFNK